MSKRRRHIRVREATGGIARGIFEDQKPGRIAGIHWIWWVLFIVPAGAYGISTILRGSKNPQNG